MPFDASLADAQSACLVNEQLTVEERGAASFTSDASRLEHIQRFVNVVAVFLFGIVGLVAGTALVALMLVALIIPTTMGVALAFAAVAAISVAVLIWMKRRAGKEAEASFDQVICLPA